MLIASRNGFAVRKRSILPPGARWVEYLESTGTQWIDTGVPVYNTTGFLIKSDTTINTTMNSAICAVFPTSVNDSRFGIAFGSSISCFTWWNIAVTANLALPSDKTYQCNFKNSRTISLGNYKFDIIQALNSNGTTATLFACNRGGGSLLFNGYARIGSAQLSDGADIVRDFRPIAIGNTGYMLDLLTGEYEQYGNKGTGDFVIGPDKVTGGATDDKRKLIKLVRKLFSKAVFRTHALRTCTKEVAA